MVRVARKDGDNNDKLVKRFMKKMKKYGVLSEVFSRRYFVKPSTKKRLEKKRLRAEHLKRMRKERQK